MIRLESCGPRDDSARPYAGLTIVSYIADSRHERKQSPRPITYGREVVRKLLKLKGRSLVETTRGIEIRAKAYALVKQPGREAISRRTKHARNWPNSGKQEQNGKLITRRIQRRGGNVRRKMASEQRSSSPSIIFYTEIRFSAF